MCGAGAEVRAADALAKRTRDDRGPAIPGVIVRPCCDSEDRVVPRVLLRAPPRDVWCSFARPSYLQGWWYAEAKRHARDLTLDSANAELGPRCAKLGGVTATSSRRRPPNTTASDDDDDDDDDDGRPQERSAASAHGWVHEWERTT
mmetsp:Transcript_24006/g.95266  ORF Transcript_24006/g.95266 Transcript_24006/m.95266 type:complete len:146 (+) Transcript_24006:691-1128(+)